MKNIKSETLQNVVKKYNQRLLFSLLSIVVAITLFTCGYFNSQSIEKESVYFNEIIESENPRTEQNVHLKVLEKPFAFAYYEDNSTDKYYFLWDENYLYIGFLTEETFHKLNVDDINSNPQTIYGITKEIPEDIRALALETYYENLEEEEKITDEEFERYFGSIYLDETEMTMEETILYILGMITFIIGIISLVYIIILKINMSRKVKKLSEEEFDKLNQELDAEESFYYKNAKLALTRNYVIDFSKGFEAILYKDIVWIYSHELHYNGIRTQRCIIIYTKDSKRHIVAALNGFTKTSKEVSLKIINQILEKNTQIKSGYDVEMKKRMKEEYQIKA